MRKIHLFVLAAMVIVAATAACGPKRISPEDAKKATGYFEMAVARMNQGDATGALDQLLEAERINPEDAEIQNALGLVYYSKEKYSKAIAHFKKALVLDPNLSDASHNLGTLYLTQARNELAIESFKRALENDLYRNRAQTLNALGFAYLKKRDYLKAEQALRECIKSDRLYFLAYGNLGKVYIALERYEDAQNILEQGLRVRPIFPEAMLDLAHVYLKLNKKTQAIDLLKQVKQIDPLGEYGARADQDLSLFE